MTSFDDSNVPVLGTSVDMPHQLAIMDKGSPKRRRVVRKRPSSKTLPRLEEQNGEAEGGHNAVCGGDGEEADPGMVRVRKRPSAAPQRHHDQDAEDEEAADEGEEEEKEHEEEEEEEEVHDGEEADGHDPGEAHGGRKPIMKRPAGSHLRDQCKSKKFNEIYDDLPGDTKIYWAGIKGRGAQSAFINSLIERKNGKLSVSKSVLLKTRVTRTGRGAW